MTDSHGAGGPSDHRNQDDEMVATERDLAEDAPWKRIQQNTFTRWANEHLKSVGKHIGDLSQDLSDGLRLIALVEVLAGKKLPKHSKRPQFRSQKLENVSVALRFLSHDEKIKIVNIDSTDIVDSKLKLILGLIWTLILHYSISLPMWEGEDEPSGNKNPTPKQRLLNWIQNKVPDLPITNFTTDWNDGRAVGALVDAVAPGLCPDWTDWSPNTALQNAREAMDLADNWLGVPQLIKPEEMVDPKVDEQSMMTYLSQYPNAKLKNGAPIRPKTSPTKVRAYGPGIEPTGVVVGAPANFTVETFSAGRGEVEITIENPQGQKEPVDIKFNNDRNLTYSVSYNPRLEGVHKVSVKFASHEIPKSPFKVKVEGFAGDASKVKASGPGLEPEGVMVGRPTYFDVITKDAGRGTPEVVILDPAGNRNSAPVKVRQLTADTWRCEYVASVVGFHSINIFFAGNPIQKSPFGVRVAPVCDARKVRVTGRGVQANGIRLKDIADFMVHTENAGKAALDIKVIGPGGSNEPVNIRKIDENNYECTYVPKKEGRYIVTISYGGHEVPRSPFEVNVGPYKESKIRAFGPGLRSGQVGHPALFTVETNGETGSLGFSIEGPSQAKIECNDNGDGTADVKYFPDAAGEYAVHILCDNEDIPKSPFMAMIKPKADDIFPDKVECSGPGLQKTGLTSGRPTEFLVDTRKAGPGKAPLDIKVMDETYHPVDVHIKDNQNGTFSCYYTPVKGLKHTVEVDYSGVATKESPYRVFVEEPTNPAKVAVFGPGVEKGVKSQTATHFNVDCRDAGPGNLQIGLTNDKGQDVPIQIHDNDNGTFSVDYCPVTPGLHTLQVLYAGHVIPQCPIRVQVQPHVDISKVKIEGLEPTGPVNSLQQFRVLTKEAGKAQTDVKVVSPSGNVINTHVIPTYEGCLVNFTPTEPGDYKVSVYYAGELVPTGPKKFKATPGSDCTKVRAYGPGLEGGTADKAAEFMIDTRGAGQGGLGVTIEGPSEAAINCRDNGDATCSVAYLPTVPGEYVVNITFNSKHIPGSPFVVKIKPDPLRQITVSGKGIQPDGVFVDSPAEIVVDARAVKPTSDVPVDCTITNPSGRKTQAFVQPQNDGTYKINYAPTEEGPHKIDITYDGVSVPDSPFVTNVRKGCNPTKCKAGGPGLTKGIVNQVNQFTVETKGAGTGGLGLAIEGPSEAKMTCKDNRDGSCTVEYIPYEAGEYDVAIKFADTHIPGSPFKVPVENAVDTTAVQISGPGVEPKQCRANTPLEFTVDAKKSAKAPLKVNVTSDKNVPVKKPEIKDNGDGTYKVTYMPPPEGSPCNVQVQWDGKDVPKSPVKMKVLPKCEPKKVKVSGPATSDKGLAASMPAELTIDTSDAGVGDLQVEVMGPDNHPRKVKVVEQPDGKHKATFVPDDVGDYKIKVKYGGEEVPNSPIKTKAHAVGKAEKCQITEGIQESVMIGEEYCITVNAKNAGTGAVTCRIRSVSGNDMDIDIEDNGDGTFSIFYKVNDAGEYTISVKFGGQPVPQGSYTVQASKEETLVQRKSVTKRMTEVSESSQYRALELNNIPLPTTGGRVTADIIMPSGKHDKPVIHDNKDGTVSVRYEPKEEGLHELIVKYNGEHVQGSPFKFHVDSVASGHVTAYGPGLTHGICGEPSNFTISTKDAGSGGLSLAVEGPSKAEISCIDNHDGTVSVSYLPTAPGEYKVSCKYADKHIKGSPFTVKVTGEGRKRNQISLGTNSEVGLPSKVPEKDIKLLNASIQSPSGLEEACFLKRMPDGNLGISFTPREIGEHVVSVKKMNQHIPKSPFKIQVAEAEVGDASKVRVRGNALKEGKTHVDNEFVVDTRDAGYGGLSLSIEGPSKAEISCKDREDGTLAVAYKPSEPGYYIVNLKFADDHVEGSPFTVKVTGEGSNKQMEQIKRDREAVPLTEVGSQCRLTFKMPGVSVSDLSALVTSPAGITEDAKIVEVEEGFYAVNFVPKELGIHTVSVKYRDIHIPGSPFQFTVGPLRDYGAHKVHAGGPGLEGGEVNTLCQFNVWTREAGAGSLAIAVEGPSKAEIDFKENKDGSCYVAYTVTEAGEYRVGIKFNDTHIPGSPFKVYISPQVGDAKKVEVGQFPDAVTSLNKPVAFIVSKNGAKGTLDCKVVAPSGAEDDCFIVPIDEDTSAVRYLPRENGVHFFHVRLNGVHVPGSPFRVKIGRDVGTPGAVKATGAGLKEVSSGQKSSFHVSTAGAGHGTLAVTIDGPSKVALECVEDDGGYKISYTPKAPGEYTVNVKYNGQHIAGSPFKVRCTGQSLVDASTVSGSASVMVETMQKWSTVPSEKTSMPKFNSDATKVKATGLALKKGHLHKQNQIKVSADQAGTNILYCGIIGPKGPCPEVFVKHEGKNQYVINYVVHDVGEHILIVKWGDDHIPGSPFKVEVQS